jgi:hypothetical protein
VSSNNDGGTEKGAIGVANRVTGGFRLVTTTTVLAGGVTGGASRFLSRHIDDNDSAHLQASGRSLRPESVNLDEALSPVTY